MAVSDRPAICWLSLMSNAALRPAKPPAGTGIKVPRSVGGPPACQSTARLLTGFPNASSASEWPTTSPRLLIAKAAADDGLAPAESGLRFCTTPVVPLGVVGRHTNPFSSPSPTTSPRSLMSHAALTPRIGAAPRVVTTNGTATAISEFLPWEAKGSQRGGQLVCLSNEGAMWPIGAKLLTHHWSISPQQRPDRMTIRHAGVGEFALVDALHIAAYGYMGREKRATSQQWRAQSVWDCSLLCAPP